MRINAVINSTTVQEALLETIKVSDEESLSIKETSVIISECDHENAPFICKEGEKKFSVGVRALVERRIYKENDDKNASVSVEKDHIGNYVHLPENVSLKEVMNAINELVRNISTPNA